MSDQHPNVREMALLLALDRVRDSVNDDDDPQAMLDEIASLLCDVFEAEGCAIALLAETSDEIECTATAGAMDDSGLDLCRAAMTLTTPQPVASSGMPYTLGNQITLKNLPLGGLILARRDRPFSDEDATLLRVAEQQIDSAIVQARTMWKLIQRNRELEAIYQIDQLRDRISDESELISAFTDVLVRRFDAALSLMILTGEGSDPQVRILIDQRDVPGAAIDAIRAATGDLRIPQVIATPPGLEELRLLAAPFLIGDRRIGAIVVGRRAPFTLADHRLLFAVVSQMDSALFERREQRRLRRLLGRSVDASVLDYLLARTNTQILSGNRMEVTVVYADLRNSTAWAETTQPETLVSALNQYLAKMTEVIFKHGGTLDKFVGDQVIGLFGAPVPMEDHAYAAARAAVEMQAAHLQLQRELKAEERDLPPLGIGISSGEVIAGEFGTPTRTEFTAVGRPMNLGARLCSIAQPGQILLSEATYHRIAGWMSLRANALGTMTLKGMVLPQAVYELLGLE